MNRLQIIANGIVKSNPTFVLVLGMCPTLGTTTSAVNGLGMGVATMAVLVMSNLVISLIKGIIPDKVRIPAFIVVIASFVTVIQMLMQAFVPGLYAALGVFIPLIVVNCIILGRAEAFASKNGAFDSILDGIGIGLGFTLSLTCLGAVREVLCEGFDSQAQMHFGRSYAESPDIDGRIWFDANREVEPGTFVTVRLTGVMDGELTGELAEE